MVGAVVVVGGDVIEKGERIVASGVFPAVGRSSRARRQAFHVAAPVDAGVVQQGSKMVGAGEAIKVRTGVVGETKVIARLEKDVIRLARMLIQVRMVLFAIGSLRQQAVNIRSIRAVLD